MMPTESPTHIIWSQIFILFLPLVLQCIATEPQTAVNVKLKPDFKYTSSLGWGRKKYTTLVYDCGAFADKSLLIKEIISDPNKLIIITSPRLWGKSMNLNMIQTFFQVQVNKIGIRKLPLTSTPNYRLFAYGEIIYENLTIGYLDTPLLISKHTDIIDKYQGKYPVIYINLGRIGYDMDYQAAIEMYKACASDAYLQHKYLIYAFRSVIQSPNFDVDTKTEAARRLFNFKDVLYYRRKMLFMWECRKWIFENVLNSLYFLSETLHKYFQKKVILLIDNYDTPWVDLSCNRDMSSEDKEKVYEFYTTFMTKTLINNKHLEKTILSGIFPPLWDHKNTIFRHSIEYNYLNGHLMEFYGYNEWEMKTWVNIYNITDKMSNDIDVYYGGYKANNKDLQIYNPHSTGAFWYENKFEKYWLRTWTLEELFEKILKIVSFRAKFYSLINDNDILVSFPRYYYTWDELNVIHEVIMISFHDFSHETYYFDPTAYDEQFETNVLMYLHISGYLTLSKNTPIGGPYHLKFPNVEIREGMKKELRLYYERILQIDMKKQMGIFLRKKFNRYLTNNMTFCVAFERYFLDYMALSPQFFPTVLKDEDQDHDILHILLKYLLMGVSRVHKEIKPPHTTGRPIVLVEFQDRIVILKIAFDKPSARYVVREIKTSPSIIREVEHSNKVIKYIGLNFYRNKTLDVWADMQLLSKPLLKKSTTEHMKKYRTTRKQSTLYGLKTTTDTTFSWINVWQFIANNTQTAPAEKNTDGNWFFFGLETPAFDLKKKLNKSRTGVRIPALFDFKESNKSNFPFQIPAAFDSNETNKEEDISN